MPPLQEGRLGDVKHIVVSVSPQTRASFAAKYGLSPLQVARRFTTFFTKVLGARAVFDTSFGRDVALVEGGAEFVERFRKEQSLPVLASSCPGWICYAEKTHGQVLPFISTCKSPMQIMGTLIKEQYGSSIGLTYARSLLFCNAHDFARPDKVYHVSVMPCYDKKLEASRDDFFNEAYRTRDVDCVLVSTEVEKMMADRSTTIHDWSESDLHEEMTKLRRSPTGEVELAGSEGSGAGGALEFVFRYAAWELFGVKVDQIEYRVGRNPDFRDVELEVDGKVVLRFAAAYGFRNIQNFVRRVKTNKSPYHYVEVMACPSACVNGGGQLRPANSQTLSKADLLEIERIYSSVPPVSPDVSSDALSNIYRTMGSSPYQGAAIDKFHTRYHAIETANISGLAVQW